MRPIVRTTIALSALAVLGVPTAAAHADQPTVTPFDDTFSFDADFCAFPVTITVHNVGYASVVATGGGFRETDHITETDTMAAFGRSITGDPYAYTPPHLSNNCANGACDRSNTCSTLDHMFDRTSDRDGTGPDVGGHR